MPRIRGSKSEGVELIGGGRSFVFEAIELALVDHVHGLDAGDQGTRAAKVLEPEHGSDDALDRPVILFDDIVELLALPQLDLGAQVSAQAHDGRCIGPALVDRDLVGDTVQIHGALEETSGSSAVAVRTQQEVDRLASAIDRAVKVLPLTVTKM